MVVVEGRRLIWTDRLVFFPDRVGVASLLDRLGANDVLRIRHALANLPEFPNLLERSRSWTSCIDLTKDRSTLLGEMDPKSCRYEIRKAEKFLDRIAIRKNVDPGNQDFLRLYNNFVRRKGHTYKLSNQRLVEYGKVSDIFLIYLDGHPVTGHLLVRDEVAKRVRLILSASSRLEKSEDASLSGPLNRYLHWHELLFYKESGMAVYDFGGIGRGTSSVAKFKLSFGGYCVQEPCYVFAGSLGRVGYRAFKWICRVRATLSALHPPGRSS